jgi:aryl-alcohol dehydrogenase-like predicted oxidoreductase
MTAAELVFGAAQIGFDYGVTNREGALSEAQAVSLVEAALAAGIRSFDTARDYGASEERIGKALRRCNVPEARVITKLVDLSPTPAQAVASPAASEDNAVAKLDACIVQSLRALDSTVLDTVLLRETSVLNDPASGAWQRLLELKRSGTIHRIGVSIYDPAELELASQYADIVHIQLPYNILDRRWDSNRITDLLAERSDITVHARSAFLQGLLIEASVGRWPVEQKNVGMIVLAGLDELANEFALSRAALCLGYVRAQPWIHGVVIGMEDSDQLAANLAGFAGPPLTPQQCGTVRARVAGGGEGLINPALWRH